MEHNISLSVQKNPPNRNTGKRIPRFLEEFYQILEKRSFEDLIDWNAEGTSILIKDPIQFAEKVLPIYFKHNNLASFIRQLNMYDFRKQKHPQYSYVFTHDSFRRDERDLLKNILRKSSSEYLRYQEKKKRREEANRMLAQTSLRIKDPESIYIENNVLKKNQRQMMAEIGNLKHQLVDTQATNAELSEKLDNLKQEGTYLIKMINALTAKLGEEKIFNLIQDQMYGTDSPRQGAQQLAESRVKLPGDSLAQEHGCATTETSSGNYDNMPCEKNAQCYWELSSAAKKVKLDSNKQPLAQLDNNVKPKTAVLTEDFEGTSNDFVNYYYKKDQELKEKSTSTGHLIHLLQLLNSGLVYFIAKADKKNPLLAY